MKKLIILLYLCISAISNFAQGNNQSSESSVANHKCEFSNNSSDYFIYKGKNYEYYIQQYIKGKNQKKLGLILGVGGVGLAGFGIISFDNSPDVNPGTQDIPIFLMISGTLMAVYGIPSYFIGNKKEKENIEIMQKFPEHKTKLGLSLSNNGLGIVLQF